MVGSLHDGSQQKYSLFATATAFDCNKFLDQEFGFWQFCSLEEIKGNFQVLVFFPVDEGRNIGVFLAFPNPFAFNEGSIIIELDG